MKYHVSNQNQPINEEPSWAWEVGSNIFFLFLAVAFLVEIYADANGMFVWELFQ